MRPAGKKVFSRGGQDSLIAVADMMTMTLMRVARAAVDIYLIERDRGLMNIQSIPGSLKYFSWICQPTDRYARTSANCVSDRAV